MRKLSSMKLLYLSVTFVVLTLYRSAAAAPVLDGKDDLWEMIKSMKKTMECLQVRFGLTHALQSSPVR